MNSFRREPPASARADKSVGPTGTLLVGPTLLSARPRGIARGSRLNIFSSSRPLDTLSSTMWQPFC
jgi:hypothetical protein